MFARTQASSAALPTVAPAAPTAASTVAAQMEQWSRMM